jgi:hypothetical protein
VAAPGSRWATARPRSSSPASRCACGCCWPTTAATRRWRRSSSACRSPPTRRARARWTSPPGPTAGAGGEEGGSSAEPKSFKELVAALRDAPRNDEIQAQLSLFNGGGSPEGPPLPQAPPVKATKPAGEVVTGGLSIPVSFGGEEEPQPSPGPELNLAGKSSLALATALRKGIQLTVRSSAPGRLVLRGYVDKKTARRLKVKKNAKGPVIVAALTKRIGDGRTRVTLKLARKAKKRLRHVNRVRLALRATITDLEGNRTADRSKVLLKRH